MWRRRDLPGGRYCMRGDANCAVGQPGGTILLQTARDVPTSEQSGHIHLSEHDIQQLLAAAQ